MSCLAVQPRVEKLAILGWEFLQGTVVRQIDKGIVLLERIGTRLHISNPLVQLPKEFSFQTSLIGADLGYLAVDDTHAR